MSFPWPRSAKSANVSPMSSTPTVRLGASGPAVFPIALGCMGMGSGSWYGQSDDAESVATIHAALVRGPLVLDTGDFYGMGRNELLIGQALRGRRDRAVLSVKFGALRGPGGEHFGQDSRPAAVKNFLAYSLARLGVDHVDVYRPARLDPQVPIEETVGAIVDLIQAGYVRHVGLSEVGAATIRRAAQEHPICDVQLEYALVSRGVEAQIVPALAELGIGMTAYGVLSRGLLGGSKPQAQGDSRAHFPRFSPGNVEKNQLLVDALSRLAAAKSTTPVRLAIAWVRAKGAAHGVSVLPTLGCRTRAQLAEALASLELELSAADVAELEAALPVNEVAGSRHPAAGMARLASES